MPALPKLLRRRSFLAWLGLPLLGSPALASPSPHARRGLYDQGGAEQSLAEVASGKTLVVVVMKGHHCAVCRAQLARLEELRERLTQLGAEVCGLNADPVEANRAISVKFGFTMPILSDPQHVVLSALGLWLDNPGHPMPAILVFDACGTEVRRFVGRDGGARPEPELLRVLEKLRAAPPQCSVA